MLLQKLKGEKEDAFACHYVGKEQMVKHLTELRKIAIKLAKLDQEFAAMLPRHLSEIDGRIRLISEL